MSKEFIYKYLSKDDLKSISDAIGKIEKSTSAELVVTIKEKRNWLEKNKSIRKLAEIEFNSSGMQKTKYRTGILFFIIVNAKEFCLLADKSINEKVAQPIWDEIANELKNNFKERYYCKGLLAGINMAGSILSTHFPLKPGDINEIVNDVRIK